MIPPPKRLSFQCRRLRALGPILILGRSEAKGTLVVLVPAENKYGILQLCWLVVSTPLKNMKVNGKDYPMYDGK